MTSFRIALLASISALVACSGADATELFGDAPRTTTSPTEPTGPTSKTDAGTTPITDAGTDGSMQPYQPDAGRTDGGSGYKSPGIFCGGKTYCRTQNQLCCASTDPGFETTYECMADTKSACSNGTPIRCDDRSDCAPGNICCALYQSGYGYRYSMCAASCSAPAGYSGVQLCDPKAPVDECAANGRTCTESQSLPGFHFCD